MAGVLILLPVMNNILCIDLLYKIDAGALINSILLCSELTYMLIIEYKSFLAFFSMLQSNLQVINGKSFLKLLFRFAVIVLPFLATPAWKKQIKKDSVINGIYEVEKLKINDTSVNVDSNRKTDSVLTRPYFWNKRCLCSSI